MKAHPFMAAAPTVDKKTAQTSDYFQVPAICILAAYNFYTGPPSPPEQNSEDGCCSAKFQPRLLGFDLERPIASKTPVPRCPPGHAQTLRSRLKVTLKVERESDPCHA